MKKILLVIAFISLFIVAHSGTVSLKRFIEKSEKIENCEIQVGHICDKCDDGYTRDDDGKCII